MQKMILYCEHFSVIYTSLFQVTVSETVDYLLDIQVQTDMATVIT
jgi:hypothetical protein